MNRTRARQLAKALVARMTLEEKAGQLRYDAPAIERLGVPAYNWWSEALHGVARAGTATVFPQAIGLAAMFDEDTHGRVARAIAIEGRAKFNAHSALGDRDIFKGLTFWSPNVNIFRDPRWGRGHETYGEDPYLTARLGVRFVRGLQGEGEYLLSAACAKHYAVHSGPEGIRHEFDARPSEKDLRETYLPAFEALVRESHVEAVMGAYNRVNGEPCCGSRRLLADILRGEWAFEGHVVSDCWAVRDFHTNHMVTDTAPQSAALAIKNGCDVNCGNTYLHLLQAVQEGLVTEADITRAAETLFTTRYLLGLFDEGCAYNGISPLESDTDENDQLARLAAQRSMVLLKNNGVLPLDMDSVRSVAVIGPNTDSHMALEGNYNGISSRYVTFLEGVRAACRGRARVFYGEGSHLYLDRTSGLAQAGDRLAEARWMAATADVTVLCLGLDASMEGEEGCTSNEFFSGDKADLELPAGQRALLKAVTEAAAEAGKKVVTVVAAGSSLRVEEGDALLWAWYPGQAGGTALADLLFGRVSPSGKLPLTFYRSADDLPAFEDYDMRNRTYRYFTGTPLYPFGFGLSYTRFAYDNAAYADGRVRVRVTNAGARDGEEVIEVYVRGDSPFAPTHPRLCGFARAALAAGESKVVEIPLDKDAFTVIDDAGERLPLRGAAAVYVGGSQPDALSAALTGAQPLKLTVTL